LPLSGLCHAYSFVSLSLRALPLSSLFFFNVPATTEIYTLSLHDALPIYELAGADGEVDPLEGHRRGREDDGEPRDLDHRVHADPDRKSTRLNSSHGSISYAVFCLKKKKNTRKRTKNKSTMTDSDQCRPDA